MKRLLRVAVIGGEGLRRKIEVCLPISPGCETMFYSSPDDFMNEDRDRSPDVLVFDEGYLDKAKEMSKLAGLFSVVVSMRGTIENSKKAITSGAKDYLRLNRDLPRLSMLFMEAGEMLQRKEMEEKHRRLAAAAYTLDSIIGDSPVMRRLKDDVVRIARSGARTVLILGDTGTGKELFARVIHHTGKRSGGPFIEVNCAAIPQALLESELFGHEEGAFTDARKRKKGLFELAHGGSIFLDEINHLPEALQVKLLRALELRKARRVGGSEEIPFDTTVIAASGEDLKTAVLNGRFRKDFYFRLNMVTVRIPPLAERGDDCILIAESSLRSICRELGRDVPRLSRNAVNRLKRYRWPGNVRELRNVLERALIFSDSEIIDADDLELEELSLEADELEPGHKLILEIPGEGMARGELTGLIIRKLHAATGENINRIARMLGLSRQTVSKYLKNTQGADKDG